MSDIPLARERLKSLARILPNAERAEVLNIIRTCLYREPPVRKAPRKHFAVTPGMKREIRRLAALHPSMHQDEIARLVGTNAGRVSEVLNGKR